MYRKLHLQLTSFCFFIIAIILTIVTCISFFLIHNNEEIKAFQMFQKNIDSICQTLSLSDNISHDWLKDMSSSNNLTLSLSDNGQPLLYNSTTNSSKQKKSIDKAMQKALETYALSPSSVKDNYYPKHEEFKMTEKNHKEFFTAVGYIPKKSGILTLVAFSPSDFKFSYLGKLYLPIILTVVTAVIILSCASYFLIGYLIKPLIKAQTAQIDFFSNASHELRSPLTTISCALESCQGANTEEILHYNNIAIKETIRMKRLVNDMFTLSALDSGTISIHKEPVLLDNLIIDAYDKFQLPAARKKIHISFHFPEDIQTKILCDSERISQVLTILLDNAISYTPVTGIIQISLQSRAHYISFSVSDSGPGIPDCNKKEIFNRFYRCDNSRTDKKHFGLGLSIAKEIVELHSGKITVSDSTSGGAAFTVSLPYESQQQLFEIFE